MRYTLFEIYVSLHFLLLQNYFAQKSLNAQLQRVGVLSSTECIAMFGEDYEIFKTCMDFFILLVLSSLV